MFTDILLVKLSDFKYILYNTQKKFNDYIDKVNSSIYNTKNGFLYGKPKSLF